MWLARLCLFLILLVIPFPASRAFCVPGPKLSGHTIRRSTFLSARISQLGRTARDVAPPLNLHASSKTSQNSESFSIQDGSEEVNSIAPSDLSKMPNGEAGPLRSSLVRLENLKFARRAGLRFPASKGSHLDAKEKGLPNVPDFYLLEDYQELFRSVEGAQKEEEVLIEGTIPAGLCGSYVVTGPGILQQDGKNVHPFDGHGLIRQFQIDGSRGRVSFQSQFVKTPAFEQELDNAKLVDKSKTHEGNIPVLYRGMGTDTRFWQGDIDSSKLGIHTMLSFRNPSNTCIIPVGKRTSSAKDLVKPSTDRRMLSLFEGGLPFLMDGSTLKTIGQHDFFGALEYMPFSLKPNFLAHTRYDADRNLLVGMEVDMGSETTIVHVELDADTLECVHKQKYTFEPPMFYIHDFVITTNCLVLLEVPMSMNTQVVPASLLGLRPLADMMFSDTFGKPSDASRGSRVIVIPRRNRGTPSASVAGPPQHAAALLPKPVEIVLPKGGLGGFHHVQAYEDEDGKNVVMESCVFEELDLKHPFGWSRDSMFFNPEDQGGCQQLARYHIDLSSKRATGGPVKLFDEPASSRSSEPRTAHTLPCDFPTTHPDGNGKKCRYMYCVTSSKQDRSFPFQVVVKADLDEAYSERWKAPNHCFVGEPIFVPDPERNQEDGGWILVIVYETANSTEQPDGKRRREGNVRTSLAILDAQDVSSGPVAMAHLNKPFPYGFHTNFCPN